MGLSTVVGQETAVTVLRRALANQRLAHAYLFDGPEGVGKRTTALALAGALACPTAPGEGCGTCEVCRRIEGGLHPDVVTVTPDGAWIVIDDLRPVVAMAGTRPHEAPVRVVLVDEAHRMNLAAANCLLKTLEEPAAGTHLILCSAAPERLLPTIRSRTQRVRFRPVAADVLVPWLVARGVAADRAATAATLADGSVARAVALATADETSPAMTDAVALWRIARGARTAMSAAFDQSAVLGDKEGKAALPETLSLLGRLLRDGLVCAEGAPDLVGLRDQQAVIDDMATAGAGALRRAVAAVNEAESALGGNVNAVLALDRMLMAMGRELSP